MVPDILDSILIVRLTELKNVLSVVSAKNKLDIELVAAVILQESSANKYAIRYEPVFLTKYVEKTKTWDLASCGNWETEKTSRATSWGLMQVMGLVARERGFKKKFLSELTDPFENISIGCLHLSTLIKSKKNEIRGLLAYNGGGDPTYPQRIEKWRDRIKQSGIFRDS